MSLDLSVSIKPASKSVKKGKSVAVEHVPSSKPTQQIVGLAGSHAKTAKSAKQGSANRLRIRPVPILKPNVVKHALTPAQAYNTVVPVITPAKMGTLAKVASVNSCVNLAKRPAVTSVSIPMKVTNTVANVTMHAARRKLAMQGTVSALLVKLRVETHVWTPTLTRQIVVHVAMHVPRKSLVKVALANLIVRQAKQHAMRSVLIRCQTQPTVALVATHVPLA